MTNEMLFAGVLFSALLLSVIFLIVMSNQSKRAKKIVEEAISEGMKNLFDQQGTEQARADEIQNQKITMLFSQWENRFQSFELGNEQKMENMRNTLKEQLLVIQNENSSKLDQMRKTVDEKLEKTLEDQMKRSFDLVGKRLEQVYHGLGEMKILAEGVGDLKKVLANVKTRGILGEIQLGNILGEILTPDQYDRDVAVIPGSKRVVEFAVKLPGNNHKNVYLPIDSKFPSDAYIALQEAYDTGLKEEVEKAAALLIRRMKQFAKDIQMKYIEPPHTTDFGVLFLPFEGLYAEAVNRGLVEILQREYKISLTGPSTMAAMLNSLQMGFKTLAIQKRSSEVWEILSSVRTEFDKFENVLSATKKRLEQANNELDQLVGVRTRQIQRKLSQLNTEQLP